MIPFFDPPSLRLGPITLHAFGAMLALAVMVGLGLTARRAARAGLGPRVTERMSWYAIVGGLAGAHLFSVLLYFPERLAEDPWLLLRFWEELASSGAFVGGALGIAIALRPASGIARAERLRLLDAVAWTLPFAWAIGRLGCTLAHDHPGRITAFPLARSLETPGAREFIATVYTAAGRAGELPAREFLAGKAFHDLGWYEFLYLTLLVAPLFLTLDRRPRAPGFWATAFVLSYAPARFLLDFLRVGDNRYGGLTPAQWVAIAALVTVGYWSKERRR